MVVSYPLPVTVARGRKAIFGATPSIHRVCAAEAWDSSPPPAASAAGGWGSPSPACTYGRVGGRSRRRRLGGVGAGGGGFGVGVLFSGGGVLRGSSSSRATCRSSTPGVVVEFVCFPPDPRWRRFWWWRSFLEAAVRARGGQVEDPAISGEVVWRRPRIWSRLCLGRPPDRCGFFVVSASSSELVFLAVHRRLRVRSSPASLCVGGVGWFQLRFPWIFSVLACIPVCSSFLHV